MSGKPKIGVRPKMAQGNNAGNNPVGPTPVRAELPAGPATALGSAIVVDYRAGGAKGQQDAQTAPQQAQPKQPQRASQAQPKRQGQLQRPALGFHRTCVEAPSQVAGLASSSSATDITKDFKLDPSAVAELPPFVTNPEIAAMSPVISPTESTPALRIEPGTSASSWAWDASASGSNSGGCRPVSLRAEPALDQSKASGNNVPKVEVLSVAREKSEKNGQMSHVAVLSQAGAVYAFRIPENELAEAKGSTFEKKVSKWVEAASLPQLQGMLQSGGSSAHILSRSASKGLSLTASETVSAAVLPPVLVPDVKFRAIVPSQHAKFVDALVALEQKHPQSRTQMKMAVIWAKKDQTLPREMFANSPLADYEDYPANKVISPLFQDFVQLLGDQIDLEKWTGYRGDCGKQGKAHYTKWNPAPGGEFDNSDPLEFMFHVSTLMGSEGHRRLIGNDIGVILFLEGGTMDITKFDLGTVPQVFCCVRPFVRQETGEVQYRAAFWSRKNVKEYGEAVPASKLFRPFELRDFLLAKMADGYNRAAVESPPLQRLFTVPRASTLWELAQNFPVECKHSSKKAAKAAAAEKREKLSLNRGVRALIVTLKSGHNLEPKDTNGKSDPYVRLRLLEQEFKSKIKKKTLDPVWNETFNFSLDGVDEQYTELVVECFDWDRLSEDDFMGEIRFPLSKLSEYTAKTNASYDLSAGFTDEVVNGCLFLDISVVTS